jgi:3-oxosteroid 1-dehydrogenase
MAAAVGAELDGMDQANVYACSPTQFENRRHRLPSMFHAEPHSILVNRAANRFVSEADFNLGEAVDRRDPDARTPLRLPVWLIADARFLSCSKTFGSYARKEKACVVMASSLDELAWKLALAPAALNETVARFNTFCDQGRDSDFQRGQSLWERYKSGETGRQLGRIEEAPFIGVSIDRFIVGTKGGSRTNASGQVLRSDGSIIRGLYASGLAMANPIGSRGVGAGATLGPNMTWGCRSNAF